jgi:DNA polymerase-3 subunit beta
MKFSCTQENLHQGLQVVSHGATKNVNLPILNNVLIRIMDKTVKLTATNLEIAVTATVRGKVDVDGEYTIPSKLFADYVALLPNDRVDVSLNDDSMVIESSATKTKIKGISASEFPLIPKLDGSQAFRVPVSDFRRALGRVIFAVSSNESRPELSGVLLKFMPNGPTGELLMAATDSYRLAEARVALHEGGNVAERSVIVPARTMAELSRILGMFKEATDAKMTMEIVVAENQILFLYDSVELISRTIEGKYPDYRAVIPENAKTSITVSKEELVKGVKTSALFSRSGIFDVHLVADAAEKKLCLRSTDNGTGENETVLLGELTGNDNNVTLNYRYLVEGINAIEGDRVTLKMVDGNTPCLVTSAGELKNYLYIVMPIRQ